MKVLVLNCGSSSLPHQDEIGAVGHRVVHGGEQLKILLPTGGP